MNTCITASCYDTLETIGVKEHTANRESWCALPKKRQRVKRRLRILL